VGIANIRPLVAASAGHFLPTQIQRWFFLRVILVYVIAAFGAGHTRAQHSESPDVSANSGNAGCFRDAEGAEVPQPQDLHSVDGLLRVQLAFRSHIDERGEARYCYVTPDGGVSPTLRVKPGDMVILELKNQALATSDPKANRATTPGTQHAGMDMSSNATVAGREACAGGPRLATSTNLHFHGLAIPSACHADETLRTLVEPADPPFEYRFQIPANQPTGLYWYHPHVHGISRFQLLGGASGALVVEGIERANRELAGLPERVFVVRDENLVHPEGEPPGLSLATQVRMRDPEGDMLNTGTGEGKPAKDLSINYVPVPFPKYPPAVIRMKPSQKELWRVANASAITYLNLQVLFNSAPQPLGIVGLDGAPLAEGGDGSRAMTKVSHVIVPPGGRVEFVVNGPAAGVEASLVTRGVDTGPMGENDPLRALAMIAVSPDAPFPRSVLPANPAPMPSTKEEWVGKVAPVRERKLYFSEKSENPNDPNSPTIFFVTVEGQTPKAFDMTSAAPNMVAQQGTVEDWTIENRTQEFHAFHIHLIHFLMTEWNGRKVDEPFLRDTVNLEYWDGKSATYPSVKLRMDFRDPNAVGILPYHCHLLEHQDGGMMGLLRIEPAAAARGVAAK
jgi:FtsP/CotA-like multicopper oxidase with cupredoxin domain